ncbi:D-alanyl-D-alanine carboxypeptidase/D-alanyl-D-alanine-endopeptidase [Pendulispora albinea]|uniref:D-alanyl-D-alanine carboxypeptidase/D-alanyl-D-alanine-endopeptidase n=1 Tax=Pendulispora albinea TaxID=2741071 RepID=A0ABZ2LS89_9BACT
MHSRLSAMAAVLPIALAGLFLARDAVPQTAGAGGAAVEPPPAPAARPAIAPGPVHDHVPELEAAVRAMAGDAKFKDAQIGVAILDCDTGHYLATSNEHGALNPASNAKVYTAGAALAMLGAEHRYETALFGTAKDGEVQGPLVLRGHGDPSLTTADLFALAEELHAQGVRRVSGDLLVDQHLWDDQTTPPAFEQQPNEWSAFRAPISAVAVNENTVTLSVRPTQAGSPALVTFDPPGFVDVDGTVATGEGRDTVILALSGNGKRLAAKVSGSVGSDARVVRYTRRVEDPSLLAGYALRSVFDKVGIKVAGEVKVGTSTKGNLLARHESEPLAQLLSSLGKQSDNFYAEMVFKTLATEVKGRPGKSADAADLVGRWINKIGAGDTGVAIKNGSGLFDANRTTATSLVLFLRAMWRDPTVQPEFLAQFAVGGVDGTLHKRFRATRHHGAIRAKTGTLQDAIALSGYVLGPPGRSPLAFSILFNQVAGKADVARSASDKLVEILLRRQWGE